MEKQPAPCYNKVHASSVLWQAVSKGQEVKISETAAIQYSVIYAFEP